MFVILTVAAALAGEQHLVYDLSVGGQPVGSREVTVRYYDRPGGERRVIESVTTVKLLNKQLDARSSGLSNPRGATFSTSATVDGAVQQIQGVQLPEGDWRILRADGKTVNEQLVRSSSTVLTSLDLLDPGRTPLLRTPGSATVVFVETGDVVEGTLADGLAATVTVAGARVPVTRYTIAGTAGEARFDVDGDGLLVRSEVTWLGVQMAAVLHALPAPRDFGTVDTLQVLGAPVGEGEL